MNSARDGKTSRQKILEFTKIRYVLMATKRTILQKNMDNSTSQFVQQDKKRAV